MEYTQTIKDTQIAIAQFRDSFTLDEMSKPNGQSDLLKSFINNIKEYHEVILSLHPATLIISLPTTYREGVVNIQPYLAGSTLPSEELVDDSHKSIRTIKSYKFEYLGFNQTNYLFELSSVPSFVQVKLKLSQRVNLFSKEDTLLETGIINKIVSNKNFSVVTKSLLHAEDYLIAYGQLDSEWSAREYVSIWLNNKCFETSQMNCWFHVKLYSLKTLYNCAWTLYYKVQTTDLYEPIAQGTDNVQPGYAYLSKAQSLFKPGLYKLKSKIVKYGSYDTNLKQIEWELRASRNYIKNE